jgi:RHS repeat-associated protein
MEDSVRDATISAVWFGVCRNSQGNLDTDKLFTGQRLDDTGLYYYNARYYDATIGRFISADTIVSNPMNPQTLNRYSYCLNNPLKYVDPSGHHDEEHPASEGWHHVYDSHGHEIPNSYQRWKNQNTGDWCYSVFDENGNEMPDMWQSGPGTAPGSHQLFDYLEHLVPGGYYNEITNKFDFFIPPSKGPKYDNGDWVVIGVSGALLFIFGVCTIGAGMVSWNVCWAELAIDGLAMSGAVIIAGTTEAVIIPCILVWDKWFNNDTNSLSTTYIFGTSGPMITNGPYPIPSAYLAPTDIIQRNMEESLRGEDYDSPYH